MVVVETWCNHIVPKAVVHSANSRFVIECNWQRARRRLVPKSGHKGHLAIWHVSSSSKNLHQLFGSWCTAWATVVLQGSLCKTVHQVKSSFCLAWAIMFLLLPYWLPVSLPSLSQDMYLTCVWMTSLIHLLLVGVGSPPYPDKEMGMLKATELRLRSAQILLSCQTVGIACEGTGSRNSCVWAEQLYGGCGLTHASLSAPAVDVKMSAPIAVSACMLLCQNFIKRRNWDPVSLVPRGSALFSSFHTVYLGCHVFNCHLWVYSTWIHFLTIMF